MSTPAPAATLTAWWCSTCGRQEMQRHAWHVRLSALGERCPGALVPIIYRRTESEAR